MNAYNIMQLNAASIKSLLHQTKDRKQKQRYLFLLILKNILCLSFCIVFVTLFSMIFGSANSTAGVVVLIALLVFRMADLGIQTKQSALILMGNFVILAVCPHLANMLPVFPAFILHFLSISIMVFTACHNTIMANHATFVLGYLLLYGNDVSGSVYWQRALGLLIGGAVVSLVFLFKHRGVYYRRCFKDIFKECRLSSTRTQWQIKMAFGVSSALLIGTLLHLPRPMWLGFACMSILQPLRQDVLYRAKYRAPYMVIGCIFFFILYLLFPAEQVAAIGMVGGFCVGFCSSYQWQTVFNCFGALSAAVSLFGPVGAVVIRIGHNILGTLYTLLLDKLSGKLFILAKQ